MLRPARVLAPEQCIPGLEIHVDDQSEPRDEPDRAEQQEDRAVAAVQLGGPDGAQHREQRRGQYPPGSEGAPPLPIDRLRVAAPPLRGADEGPAPVPPALRVPP